MPVEPPVTSPRDLAEAYAALADAPGPADRRRHGPDGRADRRARASRRTRILDLWGLDELRGIALDGDAISLGALTTYTEIRRSALCREHLPVLVEAAATIGAAQIQNRGTLGGNVANASPAGDTLPVLLAADASFVLGSARGERTVPAARVLAGLPPDRAGAGRAARCASAIPLLAGRELRFRKVGTRRAQSISKVVVALGWRDGSPADAPLDATSALALGSVAATPIRADRHGGRLEGRRRPRRPPTSPPRRSPASSSPIDDVRSTAEYRRLVAARVLHRLIREAGGW